MNILLEPDVAKAVALVVALASWLGLFALLWRLDRQARKLRRRLDETPSVEQRTPIARLEIPTEHPETIPETTDSQSRND